MALGGSRLATSTHGHDRMVCHTERLVAGVVARSAPHRAELRLPGRGARPSNPHPHLHRSKSPYAYPYPDAYACPYAYPYAYPYL